MNPLACRMCGALLDATARGDLCPDCAAIQGLGNGQTSHVPAVADPLLLTRDLAPGKALQPTGFQVRGSLTGCGLVSPEQVARPGTSSNPDDLATAAEAGVSDERDVYRLLAPALGPGELGRIGPYRILKILGVGGMGVVFQAEDVTLGRIVALKGMLPSVAAVATNRQRFIREARATANIHHEHIVTVHHVSEDRGFPYLVMEFLQGETLEDRLRRERRLPVEEILRIGLETASGLAAAHARGLVHRDIKPANIWLEEQRGRVKILDFGLARSTSDDTHLTLSGIILGTPAYMAPEQARGAAVDARTDLFSLGSVFYRMCTGQLPFKGGDTLALLTALAVDAPSPIHLVREDVPPALANLVMSLLAKAPEDRPQTAREVCEAIEGIRRDQTGGEVLSFDPMQIVLDDDEPARTATEAKPAGVVPSLPLAQMSGMVNHTLGRYHLEYVLGRGQHGMTFRARDGDELIALKVLAPEFPDNDAEIRRFSQVVGTWLKLNHPNLVAVRNAGRIGPYCWIAQELVEGDSLDSVLLRLESGCCWEWKRVYRLAVHITRALVELRTHRIVHGNITPQNILLRRADGVCKLNDALLAKVLQKSRLYRLRLDHKLEAEVPYLSPEQADGGTSFVDHLCDVYSLGVVLYVLSTGYLPYQGKTFQETLELIDAGNLIRPRKRQRSIPAEFDWTITRMLARLQEERFQNPAELLEELNRIGIQYRIAT